MSAPHEHLQGAIGSAYKLLAFLCEHAPAGWDHTAQPACVAGGIALSDEDLAARLSVRPSTVSRWRLKLKNAGILNWLLSEGYGRIFILNATSQIAEPKCFAVGADVPAGMSRFIQ